MRWIICVVMAVGLAPPAAYGSEYYSLNVVRNLGGDPRLNDALRSCWDQSANDINAQGKVAGTFLENARRRAFLGVDAIDRGESSRGCTVDDRDHLGGAFDGRGELGSFPWTSSFFLSTDDSGTAITAIGKRLGIFAGEGWGDNLRVSEGFTVGPYKPRGAHSPAEFTSPLPMPADRTHYPSLNQSIDVRVMGAKGLGFAGHGFIVGAFLDSVSNHLHPYRVKSLLQGCAPPNVGSCTSIGHFVDFADFMPYSGSGAAHEVAEDGRTVGCSVGVNPYAPFLNAFVAGTIDQPTASVVLNIHPMDWVWDFAPMTPSCAFGINSSGAVVGSFGDDGFIWGDYAGMRLLNRSFGGVPFFDRRNGSPKSGWYEIIHARAINDRGVIAANAAKFDNDGVLQGYWAVKLEPRVVISSVSLDRPNVTQGEYANLIIEFEQPAPPTGNGPPLLLETYSVFVDLRMSSAVGVAALDELVPIPGGATSIVLPVQTTLTGVEYVEEVLVGAFVNGVRKEVALSVWPQENCMDNVDNDGDGLVDCRDANCKGQVCTTDLGVGLCIDGRCVNCDDCMDPACIGHECMGGECAGVKWCVSCLSGCAFGGACNGRMCMPEGWETAGVCSNGECLDCLGPRGCSDPRCHGLPCSGGFCEKDFCSQVPEGNCWNNLDDNFDGLVDCEDPTCDQDICGPGMRCFSGECRNP